MLRVVLRLALAVLVRVALRVVLHDLLGRRGLRVFLTRVGHASRAAPELHLADTACRGDAGLSRLPATFSLPKTTLSNSDRVFSLPQNTLSKSDRVFSLPKNTLRNFKCKRNGF